MSEQLIGTEEFTLGGNPTGMTMLDFWRFMYSNIYGFQEVIAEFLVAKALGKEIVENDAYWTLFDMKYRDKRIEVKQTSYYHSFNEEDKVSNRRVFGIPKANSKFEYDIAINKEKYKDVGDKEKENKYERQNDVYVFCVNSGKNRSEAYPLNLNNWEFYIVPTYVINEQCGDNKTISLSRIKNMGYSVVPYDKIKENIDLIIDEMIMKDNTSGTKV